MAGKTCKLCGKGGLDLVEIDEDGWELVDPETYEAHVCREGLAMSGRVVLSAAFEEAET